MQIPATFLGTRQEVRTRVTTFNRRLINLKADRNPLELLPDFLPTQSTDNNFPIMLDGDSGFWRDTRYRLPYFFTQSYISICNSAAGKEKIAFWQAQERFERFVLAALEHPWGLLLCLSHDYQHLVGWRSRMSGFGRSVSWNDPIVKHLFLSAARHWDDLSALIHRMQWSSTLSPNLWFYFLPLLYCCHHLGIEVSRAKIMTSRDFQIIVDQLLSTDSQ